MSELRVSVESIRVPSADCNQVPEALKHPDNCHVVVELTDSNKKSPPPEEWHTIRFDRSGSDFVLSLKQQATDPGEFLTPQHEVSWFIAQQESVDATLQTIRIAGRMLPSLGIAKATAPERAERAQTPMVLATYIVGGKVRFPGREGFLTELDLAATLLDVYANSDERAVQELIGKIAYFQADPKLSEEAHSRVRWVVGILRLVPKYNLFLNHLVSDKALAAESEEIVSALETLRTFSSSMVVGAGSEKNFRYDGLTLEAYRAYQKLPNTFRKGKDFCDALSGALGTLSVRKEKKEEFIAECRDGLELAQMPREEAVREGLRRYLQSPRGQREIQRTIASETRRVNMSAGWLVKRGQVDPVAQILINHMKVQFSTKDDAPSVQLDAAGVQRDLDLFIQKTKKTKHREPVLATLGVLRLLFGREAEELHFPLFIEGRYQEVEVRYPREVMRQTLRETEAKLRLSMRGSDIGLPIAEGVVAAAGGTTLGLALGLKNLRRAPRNGLGYTGATLLGLGVGSLFTHFIVPPIAKRTAKRPVRNKYLWDLVGGVIGASLGATLWGVTAGRRAPPIEGMMMPPGPDDEFPVDEYGK